MIMSPVISEALLSGYTTNSATLRRRTHLVQSFSTVFRFMINMAACGVTKFTESTQTLVLVSNDNHDSVSKKQKRTISNRESARKSRIRKKKHMDDLVRQVSQLVSDNKCMAINLKDTTQMFIKMDSDNSVLKAQLAELTHQFESLNEISNGFNLLMNDDHENEAWCGW
ncbi:unnamed protein product [Lactuca virosa]|uniref:BZIP domain-containing protein n=1 Tax=Lactuca virosa TaxID=75947 RepID=A0AAU9LGT0_9ASTR|nr:unnamed protein product [Lactuca virosa]